MQDPTTIILAGDSAGGGMIISMLVILRDQGLPLPAGAVLISPWVDLTHSFPSVAGDNPLDYIPAHGFHQRPSSAWPPMDGNNLEEISAHEAENVLDQGLPNRPEQWKGDDGAAFTSSGFAVDSDPKNKHTDSSNDCPDLSCGKKAVKSGNTTPFAGADFSVMIEGELVYVKDQIQLYTTNQLLSHPLVSPVLQPSLGGLPPLIILTGGGEMLRDEQIYLAHKAADPLRYPPGEVHLDQCPDASTTLLKWKPTDVQLQVWEDLCHVAPTLSFTRPAKYMYRSISQFSAWALARAQKRDIEMSVDDDVSIISSGSDTDSNDQLNIEQYSDQIEHLGSERRVSVSSQQIGRAGDPLPPFTHHMIRQRVDRNGKVYPLEANCFLPALQVSANDIGIIKPGPVGRWIAAKKEWDVKFAKEKCKVHKLRMLEMVKGYERFGSDDVPPPSALAGRRGLSMPKEAKLKRSWGMSLWSLWGSSHDKNIIEREEKSEKNAAVDEEITRRDLTGSEVIEPKTSDSRSRRRKVSDLGQADGHITNKDNEPQLFLHSATNSPVTDDTTRNWQNLPPTFVSLPTGVDAISKDGRQTSWKGKLGLIGTNVILDSTDATRPKAGGIAFPFSLKRGKDDDTNASMVTLMSQAETVASILEELPPVDTLETLSWHERSERL